MEPNYLDTVARRCVPNNHRGLPWTISWSRPGSVSSFQDLFWATACGLQFPQSASALTGLDIKVRGPFISVPKSSFSFADANATYLNQGAHRDTIGYDHGMSHKLIVGAAWLSIAALAYATLTNVGFVYSIYFKLAPFLHAQMTTYAHFEHVIAFALFGALFALAYPKRVIFVFAVVFISAVTLEYLQTLTPDRHGTLIDACEKIVGGAVGIVATLAMLRWRPRAQN
jgi:VanZ family protein